MRFVLGLWVTEVEGPVHPAQDGQGGVICDCLEWPMGLGSDRGKELGEMAVAGWAYKDRLA